MTLLIAQLSDTHIREGGAFAYGAVDTKSFLEQAVAHLNALDPQPDAVVLSGDLVDYGTDAEYAYFRSLIAPLKAPLWVIPGNHDSARIWHAFPEAGALRGGEGLGYKVEVGPLSLLMFDSTVEGEHHGHASEARCAWLADALAATDGPSLLFLHHPPFLTGIGHMDRNNCWEAERLAATVAPASGLLAIGCGHIHRMITATVGGRRAMIAPSPAHAVSLDLRENSPATFHLEPPAILVHRVTRTERGWTHVSHQSFIGDYRGPFPFFQTDGALV
ncbi:phosphodiesterase [Acuticoccus kandeliae]|uniref:phosphodiesterase n=1 Tax=Acuticoccus kandeliae TaxID=2073160 RepID=UPI000D3E5E4F|nr:phosphodiesterase [Acuticoccus kandeliae]